MSRRARRWRKAEYLAILTDLFRRRKGRCRYCWCKTTIYRTAGQLPEDAATIDHIIPVAKDGTDEPSNLALACASCNFGKGDMLEDEWMSVIEARRAVG